MSLRKVTDDELTQTGVKSTFIVDIPGDPTSQVSGNLTAICGWGWRFSCTIDATSSTTSPRLLANDSSAIPWRRVTLFFHPDRIRRADYGRLTFDTTVENLLRLEDALFYTELDLPDNSLNTQGTLLGVYMRRSDITGAATISVSVRFAAGLGISLSRPLDARVETALAETIRGDEVVDVKFYAYTRAGGSYVARPRAMFAKLSLLRGHSDILDAYLEGISAPGFTESRLVDLDGHRPEEDRFPEYDYMSDSDLDTDDEDETDPVSPPSKPELGAPESKVSPDSIPSPTMLPSPRRMGHAVVVKGYAYKTWNALLYYLYTRKIVFCAPGSRNEPGSLTQECSPKSMYKLADAFGLTDLKTLALASLRSQLSEENIVREAFSNFTSLYAEIQDIEVQFLLLHLPHLNEEMAEMLKSICDEMRPHCFNVLRKVVCGTARHGTAGHRVHHTPDIDRTPPRSLLGSPVAYGSPVPAPQSPFFEANMIHMEDLAPEDFPGSPGTFTPQTVSPARRRRR
ncbi:hypothetical protein B0H11DRAFT_2241811 [Mycena galericulata]|nr:hypothetical protein B0H11DRAFT_2241811 [Mycena galericulata]